MGLIAELNELVATVREKDPSVASCCYGAILVNTPGIHAVFFHRFAHFLPVKKRDICETKRAGTRHCLTSKKCANL